MLQKSDKEENAVKMEVAKGIVVAVRIFSFWNHLVHVLSSQLENLGVNQ